MSAFINSDCISSSVQALEKVSSVNVNLETGIATVQVRATDQFDAAMNALPKVVESVRGLGFGAEPFFDDY